MSLARSINILFEKSYNMDKVGNKAYILPPDFTFSVICIMEEQILDIDLTHGFQNHNLVLSTMIRTPTKWFPGIPFTFIVGMYNELKDILSLPNLDLRDTEPTWL